MNTTRFIFVDILKGMAILLIVYGHIMPGVIPFLDEWVSTFHIPLFFFISGLLFNNEKYRDNFAAFLKSILRGLVRPFLLFSIAVALMYYFISNDYKAFLINLFSFGWGGTRCGLYQFSYWLK